MASEPPAGRARRVAARILRIAGIAGLAVVVLAALGAVFLSSRYFAAAVEVELAESMLETKHRTLKFAGPLRFSFWPNAGFEIEGVSLSERDSDAEFASLASARFSVAVLPLLRGRIAVDQCAASGLKAIIVRHRDGTLNIDDLLSDEKPSTSNFRIDVAEAGLRDSTLVWRDEAAGKDTVVEDVALSIARLQADTAAKTAQAGQLALSGRVAEVALNVDFADLAVSPAALSARRAQADLTYASGDTKVKVALVSGLAVDLQELSASLNELAGDVDIVHPRLAHPVKLPLRGALHAGRNSADGKLSSHFGDSKAAIAVKITDYSPLALHFDVDLDRLDVDRYLAPAHDETSHDKRSSTNLAALGNLELDGIARIGELQVAGIQTRNIKLEIRGADGKLDVRGAAGAAGK